MTPDEVWSVYERLWRIAEGAGLKVGYAGVSRAGLHFAEGGMYWVDDWIEIARPRFGTDRFTPTRAPTTDGKQPDIAKELCILAHEYGHSLSRRAGHWTSAYQAAYESYEAEIAKRMPTIEDGRTVPPVVASGSSLDIEPALAREILAEESRAWELGRTQLEALGFADWSRFDEVRAHAFGTYETALGGAAKSDEVTS